jgi:hypothetical protein
LFNETFVVQLEEISSHKSTLLTLEPQEGTSVKNIGLTYMRGADLLVVVYSDDTNVGNFVIQSYDPELMEEPISVSQIGGYIDSWALEGVYPYDDTNALVYLYSKEDDSHNFIKVNASDVNNFTVLPLDEYAIKNNVSVQISPIQYNDSVYFFIISNGMTKEEAFDRYPIIVTKDFTKTYQLEVGNISTRFVRMVGDRLVVAQSDTIAHTKIW